jgi:hypothetical protein
MLSLEVFLAFTIKPEPPDARNKLISFSHGMVVLRNLNPLFRPRVIPGKSWHTLSYSSSSLSRLLFHLRFQPGYTKINEK